MIRAGSTAPPVTQDPILIIINGESNSGGQVYNTNCTPEELVVRPAVQILNNTTMLLESLDIGTNNLIGHYGLTSERHGWENQLAHRVEDGTFGTSPVYLVKTGQGGARISNLITGGSYNGVNCWQVFYDRVTAARTQIETITGKQPKIYILYTQGINDLIASPAPTPSDWKALTKQHFANMRALLGAETPIVMTKFNDPMTVTGYNAAIDEIDVEEAYTYAVDTTGATLDNAYHWGYEGMKDVANRLLDTIITQTQPVQLSTRLAFPDATGFAKSTRGGYTTYEATGDIGDLPDIYFVTKTTDDGSAGTLRHALMQTGDRIIIFKTGGLITLGTHITMLPDNGNVTIAGYTAPGGGICLKGKQFTIQASNVIIRNLRQRPMVAATTYATDGFGISGGTAPTSNVIIDHCSVSYSSDEHFGVNASVNAVSKVTIQNCLLAEGFSGHGFSFLSNGDSQELDKGKPKELSFHRNVLVTMEGRNPKLGDQATGTVINNLGYNWRSVNSEYGGGCEGDVLYNRYKRGPWNVGENDGEKTLYIRYDQNHITPHDYTLYPLCKMYFNGNETPLGVDYKYAYPSGSVALNDLATQPKYSIDDYGFTPQPNFAELENELLPHVGAFPRDPLDQNWVTQYINNSATGGAPAGPDGITLPTYEAGTYPASHAETGIHLIWLVNKGYAASESVAASLSKTFLMLPQNGKTGYPILEEFINDSSLYV
jgi:hypothetical protein